jgi:hypothetical protein
MRRRQATLGRAKSKLKIMLAGDVDSKEQKPKINIFKAILSQKSKRPNDEAELGADLDEANEANPPSTPSQIVLESDGKSGGKLSSLLTRIRQKKELDKGHDSAVVGGTAQLEHSSCGSSIQTKSDPKKSVFLGRLKTLKKEELKKQDDSASGNAEKKPTSLLQRIKQLARKEKGDANKGQSLDHNAPISQRPSVPKCADYSPFSRLMETTAQENPRQNDATATYTKGMYCD